MAESKKGVSALGGVKVPALNLAGFGGQKVEETEDLKSMASTTAMS